MSDIINGMTVDEIAKYYAAALDSVSVMNGTKPDGMSDSDWSDIVDRNKEHLKIVLAKPWWGTTHYDLSSIKDAATRPPGTPPAKPVPSFLARDLIAQLTPDDYAAIQVAIGESPALGLLWASMLAQGDAPIRSDTQRFLDGWAGLSQAIGAVRVAAIATKLSIPAAPATTS